MFEFLRTGALQMFVFRALVDVSHTMQLILKISKILLATNLNPNVRVLYLLKYLQYYTDFSIYNCIINTGFTLWVLGLRLELTERGWVSWVKTPLVEKFLVLKPHSKHKL